MLPTFLLALREGIEAALIIGIVLGVLRKLDRLELKKVVWLGAGAAAAASLLVALIIRVLGGALEGPAEAVFEGLTMWLAAGVLTWMIFWMQRQSRSHRAVLEQEVRRTLAAPGRGAMFGLAFLAVFREGVELALFLTAAGLATSAGQGLVGAGLGLAAAALLGYLLFASARKLPLAAFFRVTNVLLILFAAGLVAHGMHEFNEAGLIPALGESVYNLNPLLPEESLAGALLKALFGYNGNPSLSEVLAYFTYFIALYFGLRLASRTVAAPPARS